MLVAELQTSVRENLPIIVVVLDDEEIGPIRVKQEIKGIPRHGVGLRGLSRTALAEGFGADGAVVETERQLGDTLQAAIRTGRTTVVAVRIELCPCRPVQRAQGAVELSLHVPFNRPRRHDRAVKRTRLPSRSIDRAESAARPRRNSRTDSLLTAGLRAHPSSAHPVAAAVPIARCRPPARQALFLRAMDFYP